METARKKYMFALLCGMKYLFASAAVYYDDADACRVASCDVMPASNSGQQIQGTVMFSQCGEKAYLNVGINLKGFDSDDDVDMHGFHVHTTGSTDNECKDAGGHFNPFTVDHGGPKDNVRHVGDLGNIQEDGSGNVWMMKTDKMASLYPGKSSIINRAIVIHAGPDDLGKKSDEGSRASGNAGPRVACCVIKERREVGYKWGRCTIRKDTGIDDLAVSGDVWIRQGMVSGLTSFMLDLNGFEMGKMSQHGFHIHANGDTGNECSAAGGHYNPKGNNHGSPLSAIRHVGDLGNIRPDKYGKVSTTFHDYVPSLKGEYSIMDKAIVIHKNVDDLGLNADINAASAATGDAGPRVACCVIRASGPRPSNSSSSTIPAMAAILFVAVVTAMHLC